MKTSIPRLRKKLGADPDYFRRVYLYTFEFARSEGQRSLGIELAQAFWSLLIPFGLKGGALRTQDFGGNDLSKVNVGWTEEHTQLWYGFLKEKNIKGISKDTWSMVRPNPFFCSSSFDLSGWGWHGELWCVVSRFLAHDRCKLWDLRHGRYVTPICSITIYCVSAPTAYTLLSPCSRMAVDDRWFCRMGTGALKGAGCRVHGVIFPSYPFLTWHVDPSGRRCCYHTLVILFFIRFLHPYQCPVPAFTPSSFLNQKGQQQECDSRPSCYKTDRICVFLTIIDNLDHGLHSFFEEQFYSPMWSEGFAVIANPWVP